jgi:hypothetical protein
MSRPGSEFRAGLFSTPEAVMATAATPAEKITVPMALERLHQEEKNGFEAAYGGSADLREADRDVLVKWARKSVKYLFHIQSQDSFVCHCCQQEFKNAQGDPSGETTRVPEKEEA